MDSQGIPRAIDSSKPIERELASDDEEDLFDLPPPGSEKSAVKSNPPPTKIPSIPCFDFLRAKGCKIPRVLDKIVLFLKMAWKCIETGTAIIAKIVAVPIKYIGLALLVAGAIHVIVVICTTPFSSIVSGGLIVLVTALVTTGAIPVLLAGAALFFFGSGLLKGDSPPLYNFLNGFPIISFFMNQIPSANYNPTDPHFQQQT